MKTPTMHVCEGRESNRTPCRKAACLAGGDGEWVTTVHGLANDGGDRAMGHYKIPRSARSHAVPTAPRSGPAPAPPPLPTLLSPPAPSTPVRSRTPATNEPTSSANLLVWSGPDKA